MNNVNKVSGQTSKALNQLQRLKPIILAIKDKTSPVVEKIKKILQKVTGKHWNTIIKAKDMATKVISKVKGVLQTVTSKAWSAMLKAQDKISPIVGKIKGVLKSITGKAWSALVKVKDMATSVLSKIKGMLVGLAAGVTVGVKVAVQGLIEEQNNKITIDRVLKNSGLKDYKKVGEEYYKYLEDYANSTPFTTAEMTTAGTKAMMMAKGDTGQAKQILDMITNTKAFVGDNRTMQEVIEAYFSAKNGNMEALNNILGENFTNFEDAQKQVLDKYGGLVQEQSKTLGGLLSTIKGKIAVNLKDMAAPFEGFISSGMTNFIAFLDSVKPKLDAFAQSVAKGFQEFSRSQTASNLLLIFQTVATTVWNAIKTVIDAVSPTIKNIFDWIGDHSVQIQGAIQTLGDIWKIVWDGIQVAIQAVWPVISQILDWLFDHMDEIKGIVQKVGNIWNDVWSVAGPLLEKAWTILKPVLSSFIDALDTVLGIVEKVSGAISGLVNAFRNLASAWRNGDVQKALSNSNAGNGNNTYQGTKSHAAGLQRVPYNNYMANLHMGEAVLSRRDADKWREGKGNSSITIAKIADTVIIREEADLDRFAEKFVRKLNQQRIITNG